eukprot:gnl/MRDRNA2_/MRDRNA2_56760_c0_seq1.p1 gnl/MRDRNA2_/MRDRNA2_56760_c0~~gnl/MRDRNA2_/MRDRNA2_56760_c0_seq1.p1  ORF type:complete len:122 (+),score=22.25 gnl/MRDRNA2_/MRDRNA2_56760_c0_seq1:111-476(+)
MARSSKQEDPRSKGEGSQTVTFQFQGEDHTFGNVLRCMLMKDPDVEFGGYCVPHPSIDEMNVQVQTHPDSGVSSEDAIGTAVDNLDDICDHVIKAYRKAVKEFKKTQGSVDVVMQPADSMD